MPTADVRYNLDFNTQKALAALKKFKTRVNEVGFSTSAIFKKIATMPVPGFIAGAVGIGSFTAGLHKAVSAFTGFESGLRGANTLLELSEKNLQSLGKSMRNVAKSTGLPVTDLLRIFRQFASGGFSAAESLDLVQKSSIVARAGFTDLNTAALGLQATVRSLDVSSQKAADTISAMVKYAGKLTFEEAVQAASILGPTFKAAGMDADDLVAAVAKTTENAKNAAIAITEIQALVFSLQTPAVVKRLSTFFGGDFDIMKEGLSGFLSKIGGREREAVKEGIFTNIRAIRGLQALTAQTGRTLDRFKELSQSSFQLAQQQADLAKSTDTQFEKAWAKVHDSFITLGEQVAPTFAKVLTQFSTLLEDNNVKFAEFGKGIAHFTKGLVEFFNLPGVQFLFKGAKVAGGAAATIATPFIGLGSRESVEATKLLARDTMQDFLSIFVGEQKAQDIRKSADAYRESHIKDRQIQFLQSELAVARERGYERTIENLEQSLKQLTTESKKQTKEAKNTNTKL